MAAFWQNLLSSFRGDAVLMAPRVTHLGVAEAAALLDPSKMTAVQMWETQPHFRTVVSFIARNIAQLGLHVFERDGEDRKRDRDSVLAQVVQDVDGHMTTFELVFSLVGDLALYDRAYWLVLQNSNMPSGWMVRRLPPTWVEPVMANAWEVKEYRVYMRADGTAETIAADKVLAFPGYHPGKMHGASPTVDALRETLQEQVEAAKYRAQVWKRGGRVSSVLERPAGAPPWSDRAREAFREDWYAKYTGRGSRAGGTPILEDGMTLRRIDFNAQEQQYVEAAKLSLQTVAAAFHVNPTMIGQNEGATYSNVREFRKMLYGDTLGPLVAQIESRINAFLVPRLGMDRRRFYVEFNIEEKLQGNFEEQTAALSSSVGAPWMTRNEARGVRNLPAVDGGDELVVPLNVLIGGQSSPRDGQTAGGGGGRLPAPTVTPEPVATVGGFTATEIVQLVGAAATLIRSGFAPEASLVAVGLDPVEHLGLLPVTVQRPEKPENPDEEIADALKFARAVREKAAQRRRKERAPETYQEQARRVFSQFFARQGRVVKSRLGQKDAEWWDYERWDRELGDDLYRLAVTVSGQVAAKTLEGIGFGPDAYDTDRTLAFLKAVSERIAGQVNLTTFAAIEAALEDDEDPAAAVANVFDVAEESRAEQSAISTTTTIAGFATAEAAKQVAGNRARKQWVVNSPNPRASHAAMDGETVGIDENFSNGMPWPGSVEGDVDETAGCQCSLRILTDRE